MSYDPSLKSLALIIASGTYTYPATDLLSFPLSSAGVKSTTGLPAGLTGSELAISDFAFTRGTDGSLYLVGGQDASGDMVPLSTIGKWTTGGGWVSQATSGTVPAGRVGASLVAHPSLDLLILHGGNVNNVATSTLAFLNTTSWTWSTPSNLQPPASSAASYHTSVVTPQGVMITAFGLGSNGSPSSNVFYLDMRDPSHQSWSWKSYWNQDMLEAYSANTGSSGNTATAGTTHTNTIANTSTSGSETGEKKSIASIVIPVIIAIILIPLAGWFIRRKVRMNKKRRMARHFSFSSQEDEGDFRTAVDSFHSPSRRTKTQYGFGTDANEKEGGNVFTDLAGDLAGAFKRISNIRKPSTTESVVSGEREMEQVGNGQSVSRLDERTMRWEEIDFGLGRLDEKAHQDRQNILTAPTIGVASTIDPFADPTPLIRFDSDDSSRLGTPIHDGQQALIPELTVQPPTVPPTPASAQLGPAFQPTSQDGLDWNLLAQEMVDRPAFRSISPTSTLRSHSHASPDPTQIVTSPISPISPISPFDDPMTSSAYTTEEPLQAPTLNRDSFPDFDQGPLSRPPRLPSFDFTNSPIGPLRRSSTPSPAYFPTPKTRPMSLPQGPGYSRQLVAGVPTRRVSTPCSETSSGSTTPPYYTPTFQSPDSTARRASNPNAFLRSPGSPGTFATPPSQISPILTPQRAGGQRERRDSALTRLRVMNMTDEDEFVVSGENK